MARTTEVPAAATDDGIRFLREAIYGTRVDPPVRRLTAYERYSARA